MQFSELTETLFELLQDAAGNYLTPYQIFKSLEEQYPALAQRLLNEYPSPLGSPQMGAGASTPYSPASFIAQALDYAQQRDNRVSKQWLDTRYIGVDEIIPGDQRAVSIWAWFG